jgi:hypothetical protein
MSYRVITFQSALFEKMMRGGCDMDLVYTPVQLVAPFQTTEDEFIFGEEGVSESDFRAGASKHPEPPGSTGPVLAQKEPPAVGERGLESLGKARTARAQKMGARRDRRQRNLAGKQRRRCREQQLLQQL